MVDFDSAIRVVGVDASVIASGPAVRPSFEYRAPFFLTFFPGEFGFFFFSRLAAFSVCDLANTPRGRPFNIDFGHRLGHDDSSVTDSRRVKRDNSRTSSWYRGNQPDRLAETTRSRLDSGDGASGHLRCASRSRRHVEESRSRASMPSDARGRAKFGPDSRCEGFVFQTAGVSRRLRCVASAAAGGRGCPLTGGGWGRDRGGRNRV